MTISSETNRSGPYPGNGVTTAFEYEFKILEPEHLQVIKTDASGVDTILVLDSDYTVNGVGDDGGGQALVAPAPATGTKITLLLNVPFTQDTDLENQGAYYAETVERAFDLMVMRLQQLKERSARAVTIPPTYDSATIDQLIANVLALGDKGAAIEAVAAVAQYLETVADVADDIPAVAGLTATTVTKAGEAAQSASDASGSAALAAAYANNGEDVVVPGSGGLFSAKHFMLKSKAIFDSLTNTVAGWIHAAAAKTPLNDDDEIGIADSAAVWVLKKISLFNLVRYIASITGQAKISGCETVYVSTTTIQMKTGYVFFNGRRTTFGAALTKALNATFVAGAAGGMLDTGVMQASKTYFIHALRNVATGAGDWVASLQQDPALVNTTNLTGWTVEGRVNVVLTTSGNVIRQYVQDGNEYRLQAGVAEISGGSWAAQDIQPAGAPANVSTEITFLLINGQSNNSAGSVLVGTDVGGLGVQLSVNVVSSVENRVPVTVRSRSTGVIRTQAIETTGSGTFVITTLSFKDYTMPRTNGA
ncbi:hypothetical protein ACVIRO_001038 [Rhizobium ruizarguesonis]